jgi:hypothetical protein
MVQRLLINGEPEYIEFYPKLEREDENGRSWILQNGKYALKFREEPLGQFKSFVDIPAEIEIDFLTEEELKSHINDLIDEQLTAQRDGLEPELETPNNARPYPYDPKTISIHSYNWSLDYILQLLNRGTINLPDHFQGSHTWDYQKQSQLIESILISLPIPPFYLTRTEKEFSIIDGLQRLRAISKFVNNEFPLLGLEILGKKQVNSLEGCFFSAVNGKPYIGRDYQRIFLSAQLNVNVVDIDTPIVFKYEAFRRLNSGERLLNRQEIRDRMMEAAPRELINRMAESDSFQLATDKSITTTRMNAQELVTRFIGLWYSRVLKSENIKYQGDMQFFLDELVGQLNKDQGKYHQQIEHDFEQAMQNAHYLFGKYAFRKCLLKDLVPSANRQLINKSLFITWSISLCSLNPQLLPQQITPGSFASLLAEELELPKEPGKMSYHESVTIGTNDKHSLDLAFAKAENLIKTHLNKK